MAFSLFACSSQEEPGDDVMVFSGTPTPGTMGNNNTDTNVGAVQPDANLGDAAISASPDPQDVDDTAMPGDIDPEATPTPTTSDAPKGPKNLSEAKKINADAIGWIKVPNTNINYPIMYDKSGKLKYHDRDLQGNKSNEGSIYSYYGDLTRNVIVTGHNMRVAKSMLHDLHTLQNNKSDLKTKSNRTFKIDLFNYSKWEVFALYETPDNEPTSTLKNNILILSDKDDAFIEKWIKGQKERSEVSLDVKVSPDDIIMTLITCGDNYDRATAQSRLYFFLKAVE